MKSAFLTIIAFVASIEAVHISQTEPNSSSVEGDTSSTLSAMTEDGVSTSDFVAATSTGTGTVASNADGGYGSVSTTT